MKILLLGKDGQAGGELQRTLLPFGQLVAPGRRDADLADLAGLEAVLRDVQPGLIVNAAAYTAVDQAESEPSLACKVNADAVGVLASHARRTGALLVHYSTDYVFDGAKAGAYCETDPPNPLSAYGRSKLAGDDAILREGCNALIFRTSWVFSSRGNNFIKTVLRLAVEKQSLDVVADQYGAPTSAEMLADVTALAISAHRLGRMDPGLYNLVPGGETSWHGLARHAVASAQARGWQLKLAPQHINAITTEQYPLPARRPPNSRLQTGKLTDTLGLELPHWTIHVDRTIGQLPRIQAH